MSLSERRARVALYVNVPQLLLSVQRVRDGAETRTLARMGFSCVSDPDSVSTNVPDPFKALHDGHVQPCPELPWENQVKPKEDEDQALERIVLDGPKGAIVLAGTATAIVILIWIVFYVLVFLPRGVIQ
jgi:hypothetical protein